MAPIRGIGISKATCAQAHACAHAQKYVILIAFPQEQWFHKCASVICYTYIACLVEVYVQLTSVMKVIIWKVLCEL
jgi:hypothetical protein